MTLVLKRDLYMVVTYLHTKNEINRPKDSRLKNYGLDTPTYRQRHVQHIAMPNLFDKEYFLLFTAVTLGLFFWDMFYSGSSYHID